MTNPFKTESLINKAYFPLTKGGEGSGRYPAGSHNDFDVNDSVEAISAIARETGADRDAVRIYFVDSPKDFGSDLDDLANQFNNAYEGKFNSRQEFADHINDVYGLTLAPEDTNQGWVVVDNYYFNRDV